MNLAFGPTARALLRRRGIYAAVVLEVALGLAVIVESMSLAGWFAERAALSSNLDEERIFLVAIERGGATPLDAARSRAEREAIASIPGVTDAAEVEEPLWSGPRRFDVIRSGARSSLAWLYRGEPTLPQVMGLDLVAGRTLTSSDARAGDATPVLISVSLAEDLFGAAPAVGQRLFGDILAGSMEVVGVFRDIAVCTVFAPSYRHTLVAAVPDVAGLRRGYILARTQSEISPSLGAQIAGALGALGGTDWWEYDRIRELREEEDQAAVAAQRILAVVMVLVVLVALFGSFGMASFMVTERQRQIGVRRALGACEQDILWHFLLENFILTSLGLALGVGITYLLFVLSLRIEPGLTLHANHFLTGALLLWVTGQVAAFGPARRASEIPPVVASRTV
ncbi:MAG: ABC transporter permease [Deltaproteobacteria bacterium]|nr:ABC transporter permease [Deltaproteobacteria bacterium]